MSRIAFVVLLGVIGGCGGTPSQDRSGGILNRLDTLPDEDRDGFPEIPGPGGIAVPPTVEIGIVNAVTRGDAERIASVDVPSSVKDMVELTARFTIDVSYPNGETDRLRGSRPLGPFEIMAEVACPTDMEVRGAIVAEIPIVGPQTVGSIGPYRFERGGSENSFDCGSTIMVETFVDETGRAAADVDVEPSGDQ